MRSRILVLVSTLGFFLSVSGMNWYILFLITNIPPLHDSCSASYAVLDIFNVFSVLTLIFHHRSSSKATEAITSLLLYKGFLLPSPWVTVLSSILRISFSISFFRLLSSPPLLLPPSLVVQFVNTFFYLLKGCYLLSCIFHYDVERYMTFHSYCILYFSL